MTSTAKNTASVAGPLWTQPKDDPRPKLPAGWFYSSQDAKHVNILDFRYRVDNHTPNWKKGVDGFITLRATACRHDAKLGQGGWLELDTTEGYTTDKGKTVTQRTMLTLDRDAALVLLNGLAVALGKRVV